MADAVIKAEVTQRPTTSRFLFKALMIIVISYPMLNGAPVATCQLSHTVVIQTQRVKSENGGSLDESEAKPL